MCSLPLLHCAESCGRFMLRCPDHCTPSQLASEDSILKDRGALIDGQMLMVQVTYTYSTAALLQKPLTIAGVVGGLFILAMGLRRVDLSIEKKAPVQVKI